jgi:hypothetical protein
MADDADKLSAQIRSDRTWDRVNAVLAGGAIGLGAIVGGALGAVSASLVAAKFMASSVKRQSATKRNDAFVFWLAESSLRPRRDKTRKGLPRQ